MFHSLWIRRERVTETIGFVLWFGVLARENFSQTSTCGKEKVVVRDFNVCFKVMIKVLPIRSRRHQYSAVLWKKRMLAPWNLSTLCCCKVKFASCSRNSQLSLALLSKAKKIPRIWTTSYCGCSSQFFYTCAD